MLAIHTHTKNPEAGKEREKQEEEMLVANPLFNVNKPWLCRRFTDTCSPRLMTQIVVPRWAANKFNKPPLKKKGNNTLAEGPDGDDVDCWVVATIATFSAAAALLSHR